VVTVTASPVAAPEPAPWTQVRSEEGGFDAQFPAQPTTRREEDGRLIYELDTDEARFVVQSVPIVDDAPAEKIMAAVTAGIQAGGAKLSDARESSPAGMRQLDASMTAHGLHGRMRLIVHPHHRVLICTVKFLGDERPELAERFLGAFAVRPSP
jgi:hypothetical protein